MISFVTVDSVEASSEGGAQLTVRNQVLHSIDTRLFGQFFERASFGDHGPEWFVDPESGKLPESIVKMLESMEIPVVRFPGGTDVDYIDWRDMIDNVPDREGARPLTRSYRPGKVEPTTITNHFGYDEYFELRDQLGWQTILVVNLLDGLAARRPLEEAADVAAGLVAYANAPLGSPLPDGMPDWASIRSRNGHPKPYGAEYIQIGNEIFLTTIRDQVIEAKGTSDTEVLAAWYIEVLTCYIRRIRAVDPEVAIIIDALMGEGISESVQADPYIRSNVKYLTRHRYAPGSCTTIRRGEETLAPEDLSDRDFWWAWTSMPGVIDEFGQNQAFGTSLEPLRERGYLVASTEWNWNGWAWRGLTESFEAPAAAGIGAASFVQGMMRQGDQVRMATQSMLLGGGWSFAAVFGDRSGEYPPYYTPQGSATTFYRKHHGSNRLWSDLTGVETHPQPFRFGWGGGVDNEVAEIDALATADRDRIFVHAINRTFDQDLPLHLDLTDFDGMASEGIAHHLTFRLHSEPGPGGSRGMAQITESPIEASSRMTAILPARTITILELPLEP